MCRIEAIQNANQHYFESFGITKHHQENRFGQGVTIALLDSAIPELSHHFGAQVTQDLSYPQTMVPKNINNQTHLSHGLFMTSLLEAIVPKARLKLHAVATDFMDESGQAISDEQYYLQALNICLDDPNVDLINLSWSPQTFARICDQVHESEKTVVLAAGNLGLEINEKRKDINSLLQKIPNLILVGAYDHEKTPWPKSNTPGIDHNGHYLLDRQLISQDKVCDLSRIFHYAPGVQVMGKTLDTPSPLDSWSGTSIAAIFMTGLLALEQSNIK